MIIKRLGISERVSATGPLSSLAHFDGRYLRENTSNAHQAEKRPLEGRIRFSRQTQSYHHCHSLNAPAGHESSHTFNFAKRTEPAGGGSEAISPFSSARQTTSRSHERELQVYYNCINLLGPISYIIRLVTCTNNERSYY